MIRDLNPAQQKAVIHKDGPLLVIAGAGSGKTRVITYRIAKLINEDGINPYNILALTFTNKAASEMKKRIEPMLGQTSLDLWVSTFHSACVRILRSKVDRLGYSKDFVIYDTVDQNALIKECLKEAGLNDEKYSPMAIASKISFKKNERIERDDEELVHEVNNIDDVVQKIFPAYQKKLKANNAMDFDDLLLIAVKLFKSEPDVLEHYQNRFQHILVDEYQDTNYLQYEFICLLAGKYQNICVVGDEDQSIYRWRGANIENILNFEKNFKNTTVVKLEENYRSTKIILEASNHVISRNRQRKGKTLFTKNETGQKITYYRAFNETEEGDFIRRTALELQREGKASFSDIAIFYRTNAQSRVIEESLRKSDIPYQVIGGQKFYDRKEIKDIIAYCRVIVNPDDSISLDRILNTNTHGIGKVTSEKINVFAHKNDLTRFQALEKIATSNDFKGAAKKKIEKFYGLLNRLRKHAGQNSVSEVIKYIQAETGYVEKLMNEKSFEAENRIENLKELITAAKSFEENNVDVTVNNFLDQAALVSGIDTFEDKHGLVTLMTLHNSKGLEFPIVFITGMEERIFPHVRSMNSEEEMEEERRLCYVGMTRTKNRLFFLNAIRRKIYGMEMANMPSEFIGDIPSELIETTSPPARGNYSHPAPYNPFPMKVKEKPQRNDSDFSVGTKVLHSTFGNGIVLDINGNDADEILVIFFKGAGKKKLKTRYANLKVL